MPPHDTSRQAAAELARLLATAARQNQAAQPHAPKPQADARHLRHLIATLAADPGEVDRFFPALGRELKARGLQMPSVDAEHLPPDVVPLLAALEAALGKAAVGAPGNIDYEALVGPLNQQLGQLLGESPRAARERLLGTQARERAGKRVAAAMRRHGLVPLGDTPAAADGFWDMVDAARHDPTAFVQRLGELPRERLAAFYWEHVAAVQELRRAGLGREPQALAEPDIARRAAQVVAGGYEHHAAAVAQPAPLPFDEAAPGLDLGAEAARIFRQRFGEPVAPGL